MAAEMSRNQERKGERLNDGLSALAAGQGPPLVILPGFGPGADLSVRVPRSTAWSTAALAAGFKRTVHEIHRPVRPAAGMTIATLAGWHALIAHGPLRLMLRAAYGLAPSRPRAPGEAALVEAGQGWDTSARCTTHA
jgi:hypothetical protein